MNKMCGLMPYHLHHPPDQLPDQNCFYCGCVRSTPNLEEKEGRNFPSSKQKKLVKEYWNKSNLLSHRMYNPHYMNLNLIQRECVEVSWVFSAVPGADPDGKKQRRQKVYEEALKKLSSVTATEKTAVEVVVGEGKEKGMGCE